MVRKDEKMEIKWIALALVIAANLFAIHMRTLGVVLVIGMVVICRILFNKDENKTKKIVFTIHVGFCFEWFARLC